MAKQVKSAVEKGLVPRLRFPDFAASDAWDPKTLARLENEGVIKLGRGNVISHQDMRTTQGDYPVYSSSAAGDGCMGRYGLYMFNREMITWSIDGGGRFFYRAPHKFSVTNVCGYIDVLSDKISCRFLAYQLQYLYSHKVFDYQLKAHPSVIRNLYSVPIASRDEQQKIADCLSSLDERIAAETRRLDALKTHKQGLLQQLFPRQGETIPQRRLAGFNTPWRPTTLAGEVRFLRGAGISKADVTSGGSTPCIRYGELYTTYGEVIDRAVSSTALSRDSLVLSEAGDVIVPTSGETKEDIATASCVLSSGIALGGDLIVLRSAIVGSFLSYYVRGVLRDAIAKVAQGDSVVHLYPNQLGKVALSLPEADEQQKIADCFISVDDLIATQVKKIGLLKQHKRGLMQQLFPVPNEVAA